MDVFRRHRVQAGSGGHSVSYPEGTIAIFPWVTEAVFLESETTLTPSKGEVKNAKIRTRPSGALYVHCLLSVLMVTSHVSYFEFWIVPHTPNIEVLCSNKGFAVEISSSNTPPRELYRIILSESNDKTWWWSLPAETCSFCSKNITSN